MYLWQWQILLLMYHGDRRLRQLEVFGWITHYISPNWQAVPSARGRLNVEMAAH